MSANVLKICDSDLDVFEVPIVCKDVITRSMTPYVTDNGETFNAALPSYTIRSKDLDQFLDIQKAYMSVTVSRSARHPMYGYGDTGANAVAAIGEPMSVEQASAALAGTVGVYRAGPNAIGAADLLGGANGVKELNGFLYRLFSQMRYLINDTEIERVESIIDVVETRKRLNDSPVKLDYLSQLNSLSQGTDTYPIATVLGTTEKTFIFSLAEIFGSCDVAKIMRGIRHSIQLFPDFLQQHLYSTGATAAGGASAWIVDTIISKLQLWVPIVHPSDQALRLYEKQIDQGLKAVRIFENANHYESNSFTSSQFTWNVIALDNKPTKVVCWITNGNVHNRSNRAAHVVDRIELQMNSRVLPVVPYEFSNSEYQRAYLDFLRVSGRELHDEDAEPTMNYNLFRDSQRLFCFDLPNTDDIFDSVKNNDMTVRVTLAAAPVAPNNAIIHAVVFSEYQLEFMGVDSRLAITQSKEPLRSIEN